MRDVLWLDRAAAAPGIAPPPRTFRLICRASLPLPAQDTVDPRSPGSADPTGRSAGAGPAAEGTVSHARAAGGAPHPARGLSHPELAVQHAVLDRFGDVVGGDGLRALQVRDGAGDLERPVVGPCREPQLRDRLPQELLSLRIRNAVPPYLPVPHLGVAVDPVTPETRRLPRRAMLFPPPPGA